MKRIERPSFQTSSHSPVCGFFSEPTGRDQIATSANAGRLHSCLSFTRTVSRSRGRCSAITKRAWTVATACADAAAAEVSIVWAW